MRGSCGWEKVSRMEGKSRWVENFAREVGVDREFSLFSENAYKKKDKAKISFKTYALTLIIVL